MSLILPIRCSSSRHHRRRRLSLVSLKCFVWVSVHLISFGELVHFHPFVDRGI